MGAHAAGHLSRRPLASARAPARSARRLQAADPAKAAGTRPGADIRAEPFHADARRAAFDDDPDDAEEAGGPVSSIADPDALFEPPMPPAVAAPVEPAPEDPEKAHAKAVKAQNRRYSKCYDLVMSRHPDIKARLREAQDVSLYFDSEYRLLPPELWPAGKSPAGPSVPAVSPAPKMTNVDGSGHAPGGRAA